MIDDFMMNQNDLPRRLLCCVLFPQMIPHLCLSHERKRKECHKLFAQKKTLPPTYPEMEEPLALC